jgi:hypothetical protein
LDLPEDRVNDFEVLLEYMLRGQVSGCFEVQETGGAAVQRCIDFLEYADKYELGAATCDVVYEPLKKALSTPAVKSLPRPDPSKRRTNDITEGDIELVYRISPADSPLRTLVAQAALSAKGILGSSVKYWK